MSEQSPARQNPLGTQKIGRLILRFSIPAIISMIVNAIYNIVDQVFIGRGIGIVGIAATNVAFPLVTICTAIALLLGIGASSKFNLSLGKEEPEEASKAAGNALSMLVVTGVAISVLAIIFLKPMLMAFGATDENMAMASSYTMITNIGIPFLVLTTGGCHIIRADGNPRFSMICLTAGAVFNLIFDPIFLFVFHMGIEGIALATTLGQVLSGVLTLYYLLRKFRSVPLKREHFRIRWNVQKSIYALGSASCFNQLAMTVVQIALNNVLRHYGALSVYGTEIALGTAGVISKVNILFLSFVIGLAQGCQPIVGYNYGAKNYGRVRKTYQIALIAATGLSIAWFLAFQLFPRPIIGIFGDGEPLYFEFAIRYLRIFMLMTFINGIQPVTANYFTSTGKASVGFFISLTRQILFFLPLVLLLPLAFGLDGVLYSGPIADGAAAALTLFFTVRELRVLKRKEAKPPALSATSAALPDPAVASEQEPARTGNTDEEAPETEISMPEETPEEEQQPKTEAADAEDPETES